MKHNYEEKEIINQFVDKMWHSRSGSPMTDIFEAYQRPSYWKVRAWEDIKNEMRDKKGWNLIITGYNMSSFSSSYLFKVGEQLFLRHFTAWNDWTIPCTNEELIFGV